MTQKPIITNDRQAREIAGAIEQITEALSSEHALKSIVQGLPREVVEGVRQSLQVEKNELLDLLDAYSEAKAGRPDRLRERIGNDPGGLLVVARVARGWSQKELARRLFIPEQQVQRYEAERYRSISLGNLTRVARTLGVRLTADLPMQAHEQWLPSYEMSQAEAQKVLKHARAKGWLEKADQSDESGLSQLKRAVAEHVADHGTPSLLRTGLNVEDHSGDWFLLTWKAQVTRQAQARIQRSKPKYKALDVAWIMDLARLSVHDDGPKRAESMLEEHGIILIVERQITGMKVDGAAFLVDDIPVIGLTLRQDRVDNFWFTLMHELGHVILHYRTGLSAGFFDNTDEFAVDELEQQADEFASNVLIPEELWTRSPARIAKSPEPLEKLAMQLGIAPAIVFGRVRMERKNYTIFSNKLGAGKIRKLFEPDQLEATE